MSVSEKLYPPTIPSSIPAFYEDDGTVIITVPFIMNKAVSANEITNFVLKVKSIQTNSQLVSLYVYEPDVEQIIANGYVQFSCSNSSPWLTQGPYFKFQLAYKHNDVTGYFSSVATGKKTVKPIITLDYFLPDGGSAINGWHSKQHGTYETTDLSEGVAYYIFNLYDNENNLIESSDWQTHNSTLDTIVEEENSPTIKICQDTYEFITSLKQNEIYKVQYGVKTVNNCEIYTDIDEYQYYQLVTQNNPFKLNAQVDNENGIVKLSFSQNDIDISSHLNEQVWGIIQRSSERDQFITWQTLIDIHLDKLENLFNDQIFNDFTVEQGIQYKYHFEIYGYDISNNTKAYYTDYANKNIPIFVDFEDMFLYDGEKQVKIKFNPKVSSFKETILESKIDTIGSKYPYFFRNQQVGYKEFPISGLISYLADDNETFLKREEYGITTQMYKFQYVPISEISQVLNLLIQSYKQNFLFKQNIGSNTYTLLTLKDYSFLYSLNSIGDQNIGFFRGLKFSIEEALIDFETENYITVDNFESWYNSKSNFISGLLNDYEDLWKSLYYVFGDNQIIDDFNKENQLKQVIKKCLYRICVAYNNTEGETASNVWSNLNNYILNLENQKNNITFFQRYQIVDSTIQKIRDATPTNRIIPINLPTTNLTGYNIRAEREFKMQLLDWLNNGKVKLFRSPTEGNFLIRLMNVSLTPEDRLGRMLHSFQAQAYEVANLNYQNLLKYNFVQKTNKNELNYIINLVSYNFGNGQNVEKVFISDDFNYATDIDINNHIINTSKIIDLTIKFSHNENVEEEEEDDYIKITYSDNPQTPVNIIITPEILDENNYLDMTQFNVNNITQIDATNIRNWNSIISFGYIELIQQEE